MWNKRRSILLSKIFVIAFFVILAASLVWAPALIRWVMARSLQSEPWQFSWFLLTIYSGGLTLALLLYQLYRVLMQVGNKIVFDWENVRRLRLISWLCFGGSALCITSAVYYLPWLIVAMAAAFIGLVVRIVKNILAEATSMKEENDLTI